MPNGDGLGDGYNPWASGKPPAGAPPQYVAPGGQIYTIPGDGSQFMPQDGQYILVPQPLNANVNANVSVKPSPTPKGKGGIGSEYANADLADTGGKTAADTGNKTHDGSENGKNAGETCRKTSMKKHRQNRLHHLESKRRAENSKILLKGEGGRIRDKVRIIAVKGAK